LKDFIGVARGYALDVVEKRIDACQYIKQACRRYLRDLERAGSEVFPYYLNESLAIRSCTAFEMLRHIKGKWARGAETIVLEPWQVFIQVNIYGWCRVGTELRRFQEAYIEIPRKNGKTSISAGNLVIGLALEDEPGAECYSAATTAEQAGIAFNLARAMVMRDASLQKEFGIVVNKYDLAIPDRFSLCKALSSEASTLDGLSPHITVIDELHAHKSRDVYDIIQTALGSREQPLVIDITTSGTDQTGICYEVRDYGIKVLSGAIVDETRFVMIYTIDEEDNNPEGWFKESTWQKANPNYGVSVMPNFLEAAANRARNSPAALNNFLTKHLNVWCNAAAALMDMVKIGMAVDRTIKIEDFEGEECRMGIDLAAKIDICATVRAFKRGEKYYLFAKHYIPEATVEESTNAAYSGWARTGVLTVMDGEVIDQSVIEDDILDDYSRFRLTSVRYDPWQAENLRQRLEAQGVPMVELRQTVANMSEATKHFQALAKQGRIVTNGDPAFMWQLSNIVGIFDKKDNVYPHKEKPEKKIDAGIAAITAIGAWMDEEKKVEPAMYAFS
jgi:phage terminase large subunit-like protein